MAGRNATQDTLAALHKRIRDPHVAPLNALADRIADSEGLEHGTVPYVDPNQGGIHARALILLDNPGRRAQAGTGSGILSLDNDDLTSENQRAAFAEFKVSRKAIVSWNVCPVPTRAAGTSSLMAELRAYAKWTDEFVRLCPNLEIVLPLGVSARAGWALTAASSRGLHAFDGRSIPHPSNRGLNRTPDSKLLYYQAIAELKHLLDQIPKPLN